MSLLLIDFVTEVVLLQIVIFSFIDLHYVLAALSQVHIHISKTHSPKFFSNATGNKSVGNLFHYISKKNVAFFSNKAQHLRGPLELLSRKNLFYWIQKNSVKSVLLSLVTDVTQYSESINKTIVFAKLPLRRYFL